MSKADVRAAILRAVASLIRADLDGDENFKEIHEEHDADDVEAAMKAILRDLERGIIK